MLVKPREILIETVLNCNLLVQMSDPVGFDLNQDPEKDVELNSSRKRSRPTSWTKEECIALYEVLEGLSADERGLQKEAMWEIVSGRMGNTKNSTECKVLLENTLQQYRYRHRSASSVVPYTQLKDFVQQEFASIEPSPSERAISVSFEGCPTSIDINACSEVVAAATIRSTFGLDDAQIFWLVDELGTKYGIDRKIPPGKYSLQLAKSESAISVTFKGSIKSIDIGACSEVVAAATIRSIFDLDDAQIFWLVNKSGSFYGIDRKIPPGNYTLHLAKSERAISVNFKGCRKSFDINASSEIIAAAIRSVFGLEDAERFWLENKSGIVYGAYRNMLRGNYRLHLVEDPKRNQQTRDFTARS